MSTSTRLMTAEELWNLPKDGFRYELVEGELRQMSPSGTKHGAVIFNLSSLLGPHLGTNNLGQGFGAETGFKIASDPDTVRAPDIAFVRRERIPPTGVPENFWPIAPDLVVEVVSPGDTFQEVEDKVEQWLAAGASAVWVFNPQRRSVSVYRPAAEVIRLSEADELDGGDVVPGFRCKVSENFV